MHRPLKSSAATSLRLFDTLKLPVLAGVFSCLLWSCGGADRQPAVTGAVGTQSSPEIPLSKTSSSEENKPMSDRFELSESEWKLRLSPEQYHVLRKKGTEAPFNNEFDDHFEPGTYSCAACGAELFESETKFNSGCGWPAFYAAKAGDKVELHSDRSHGMVRTEVVCARCGSHLGHVFNDAPQTPTGERFCINSVSLKFTPKK